MADDLTILTNSPNKDGDSDVIKSPVVRALHSYFTRCGELVNDKLHWPYQEYDTGLNVDNEVQE
jgi:hypothetical protein